jgi:hypothetical protein
MNPQKTLKQVLSGSRNIRFQDFVLMVQAFGFREARVKGSHHIFVNPLVIELLNLQEVDGKVKPYQIRQFLQIVERYNLKLEEKK